MKKFSPYLLCFLMLGFGNPSPGMAQTGWMWANRLQIGVENDSNVFESSRFPVSAADGRLLLNSKLQRRWNKLALATEYSAGLQAYPAYRQEHKLTHDGNASLRWQWTPWLEWQATLKGYLKIYFGNSLDFAQTFSGLNARIRLPKRWMLRLSADSYRLDYKNSDSFDFTGRTYGFTVQKSRGRRMSSEAGLRWARLRYLRPAFVISPDQRLQVVAKNQQDHQTGAYARFSLRLGLLLQAMVEWQRNRSNSFGYSYNRWRISALAGWPISPRVLVRLAALLQYKKYTDKLLPIFPIELDAERNESNFLVADLSYDLNSNLAWLLRLSWYDNESAIRGLFYRKVLVFSGLEFRF